MGYKDETRKAYDMYTDEFAGKFEDSMQYILPELDLFLKKLEGKKILDLGSGPGHHAEYFKEKGFDVLCGDISVSMVELCQKRGLRAEVMDIENLQLPENSFDGVWSYTSLLHVPRRNMTKVIEGIARILKPKGIFALAVKKGREEGFEIRGHYPGTRRWFTYFTDEEIRTMTSPLFKLLRFSSTEVKNGDVFLNYVFRLR